ncbi:hypothetical protein [Piscirickettsia litoralis]|uniref:Uncharacterized protein n=1 Tax=Piscirickettsia litoralis TaxID=1891921 RepID=A0ABX3A5K0_9GAMM|nr:hypothetical protein [Piscirickettsia litoralis]ODN43914.1 hypothetical protein BGC07_14755 [Piscirickettsia litoralis]
MRRYIAKALAHLQGQSTPAQQVEYDKILENPFQSIFDAVQLGHSEEINLNGCKLRKASIGRLLKSAQSFHDGDIARSICFMDEAIPTLVNSQFGFFDYFNHYQLWVCEKNNGLIFVYALYLNYNFFKGYT